MHRDARAVSPQGLGVVQRSRSVPQDTGEDSSGAETAIGAAGTVVGPSEAISGREAEHRLG